MSNDVTDIDGMESIDEIVPETVFINASLSIPMAELSFRTARGGGPGGQHVNKVETKVILSFNVADSPSLSIQQRGALLTKLDSRIDKEGVLQISAQSSRSQHKNKEEAIERFCRIVAQALVEQKPRRATKPTRRQKQRRLDAKKRRGQRKKERSQKWD